MAEVAAVFTADISGYTSAMSRMASSTTSATKGASNLRSKVSSAMSTVGKVTTAAGAATTAMGVSALKSYGTFQASLNKAAIVAGGTSKDIGELADMANKMGADLPLSAQDAADAMVSMAQDGASIKTITKEFPAIAEAATATGADLQTTAGTVQQAMNIWGKSLKSPARAAAILTQTANLSNASVEDMSGAIANIGGVASQAKFGMGDMTEAIGLLTNKGFTAQRASRDLAHAIIQMEAPSKSAKKEMNELGLSFTDAQGKMKPFPTILKEVAAATDGMSASQKTAALKAMFNTAGMQAMLPLLDSVNDKSGNTATSWDAYAKAQDGASSSAAVATKFLKDQAKDMQQNIGSKIEQIGGNWESLRNTAMSAAGGVNSSVVDMINNVLTWAQSSNSSIAKISRSFIGLSPVIGASVTAFGSFLTLSNSMSLFASNFTKNMSMIGRAIINPWTLGVAAIALFIVALAKVYQSSASFRSSIDGIVKSFKSIFNASWIQQTVSTIQSIFKNLLTTAENVASGMGSAFSNISWTTVFGAIRSGIDIALNALNSFTAWINNNSDWLGPLAKGVITFVAAVKTIRIITSVVGWVQGAITVLSNLGGAVGIARGAWSGFTALLGLGPWGIVIAAIAAVVVALVKFFTKTQLGKQIWSDFTTWLGETWQGIKDAAVNIWNGLGDFFTNLWPNIVSTAQGAWQGLNNILSGLWNGIKNIASTTWGSLGEFFAGLWNSIATTASGMWTSLIATLSGIWQAIITTAQTIWQPFGEFFSTVWNGIKDVVMQTWTNITSYLTNTWNSIQEVAGGVWEMIKSVIAAPVLVLADIITGQWDMIKSDLMLVWNGLKDGAAQIWNGIRDFFSNTFNSIKNTAINVWNNVSSALTNIWNGIKSIASSVWNGIKSTVTNTVNGAVSGAKSAWNNGKAAISNIWNGMKSAASSAWNGMKSAIGNAAQGAKSLAQGAWSGLRSATSSAWSGIKSMTSGAWSSMKSIVGGAARGMVSAASSAWSGMRSAASNVVSSVKSAFQSLSWINLWSAGSAIMNSFLGGLRSAWGGVKSFVSGIAGWVRKHKGPISYDAKLLIPAGNAMMNGLNSGLMNSFSTVQRNVSGMADKLSDSINSVAGDIKTGDLSMQAASYQGGSIDQNIDTNNWVEPTFIVKNELVGDKIYTTVKSKESRDYDMNKFFKR